METSKTNKLFITDEVRDYIKEVETTPNMIVNILLYIIFSSEKYFLKYFNFSFGISIYALIQSD